VVPLKEMADVSPGRDSSIEKVLVVRRTGSEVNMVEGRDVWWQTSWPASPPEHEGGRGRRDTCCSSSTRRGTTAKPKGIVTPPVVTPLVRPSRITTSSTSADDVYWVHGRLGWVTGHSYIVYGR